MWPLRFRPKGPAAWPAAGWNGPRRPPLLPAGAVLPARAGIPLDLRAPLGVPVTASEGPLFLNGPVWRAEGFRARSLEEMRPFLADPDADGPPVLYFLYHDLRPVGRAAGAVEVHLTWLNPGLVGEEWVKTAGHDHVGAGRHPGYPELMEVVHGRVLVLLQRMRGQGRLAEVLLVTAETGDLLWIPPGYAHLAVNPGLEAAVLLHARARSCRVDYEGMARYRGAGYYLGPGGAIPNPNYVDVPPPVRLTARDLAPPQGMPGGLAEGLAAAVFGRPEAVAPLVAPDRPGGWPALSWRPGEGMR
ncbi:putative GPI domain-containing protein [Candidatus Hydrogenisulfobacillus filiaventi]|uniref:glucose-6-phosphate isomerase n=1 Tax=Candidatus Hydrogenisulfobacillus filiaventi TaxID=2707344 RepID=A0A6F8ZJN4_9FIRM|nr:hypothetical protein [Bacillota bacterium]CAB1130199.1 putative GPI domain-containing protein [Candidatus Hydrogenisulfobacillus filiaventi]